MKDSASVEGERGSRVKKDIGPSVPQLIAKSEQQGVEPQHYHPAVNDRESLGKPLEVQCRSDCTTYNRMQVRHSHQKASTRRPTLLRLRQIT